MGRKKVEEHTPKFTVKREGCHFRLVALREFWCHDKYIKRGEQGGLVDNELNLSQEGSCWITKDACVYGNARVYGDALITDKAIVCADAVVMDNAVIRDDCQVCGKSIIRGNAVVAGSIELVNAKLGKDFGEDCKWTDDEGRLISDAYVEYNPRLGRFHVNNYSQPNHLIVNIKTVVIDGKDKREDETEEQYRKRKVKEHKNTYVEFCRIVGK